MSNATPTTATEINIVASQPANTEVVDVFREVRPVPARMHWATALHIGLLERVAVYYVPRTEEGHASPHHINLIRAEHPEPNIALVY